MLLTCEDAILGRAQTPIISALSDCFRRLRRRSCCPAADDFSTRSQPWPNGLGYRDVMSYPSAGNFEVTLEIPFGRPVPCRAHQGGRTPVPWSRCRARQVQNQSWLAGPVRARRLGPTRWSPREQRASTSPVPRVVVSVAVSGTSARRAHADVGTNSGRDRGVRDPVTSWTRLGAAQRTKYRPIPTANARVGHNPGYLVGLFTLMVAVLRADSVSASPR